MIRPMTKQNEEKILSETLKKEANFFDHVYEAADRRQEKRNYLIPDYIVNQFVHPHGQNLIPTEYMASLLGNLQGKKVLDYGAGDGWLTICYAKAGARVWAIDISRRGIDLVRKKAVANGVDALVSAEVRDCYHTSYKDDMFDVVCGVGILHHLDIKTAVMEICRILKPDGIAVFYEPIRDAKIMDFIKKVVLSILRKKPSDSTENESPINMAKIESIMPCFGIVAYRYFNVLGSASRLITNEALKSFLYLMDYFLIKCIPGFKKLGMGIVIELRNPIKTKQIEA